MGAHGRARAQLGAHFSRTQIEVSFFFRNINELECVFAQQGFVRCPENIPINLNPIFLQIVKPSLQ